MMLIVILLVLVIQVKRVVVKTEYKYTIYWVNVAITNIRGNLFDLIKYINFDIFLGQINETESIQIPDQINYDDTFEYLNLKSAWSHDVFVAQEPVCNPIIKTL